MFCWGLFYWSLHTRFGNRNGHPLRYAVNNMKPILEFASSEKPVAAGPPQLNVLQFAMQAVDADWVFHPYYRMKNKMGIEQANEKNR